MNLAYIVNPQSEVIKQLKYTDTGVVLNTTNKTYVTKIIKREDFSYLRFTINFDRGGVLDDIVVSIISKNNGLAITSSATGSSVVVPTIKCLPRPDATEFSVLLSDGDIPLYDDDIYIHIEYKNNTVPITLREITVIKLR